MDCEDGAQTGKEKEHAEMIVRIQNSDLECSQDEWGSNP